MANHQSLPQHGKPSPTLSLMLKEFTEKNLRRLVLRSLCLVYGLGVALGWLWGGFGPLFLLSTFCFLGLPECGFGWLKRSRFRVQGSRFDVRFSSDNVCPFLSRPPNRVSSLGFRR